MRPFLILIFFSILYFSLGIFAQESSVELSACQCRFSHKDYDPEKGYYFDRVTYFPVPKLSGRFACIYTCQDSTGEQWDVNHLYKASYIGWKKGGVENAKKFICPSSVADFTPKYDAIGHLLYYETTLVGNFSAASSGIPEIQEWAQASGCR